MNTNDGYNFFQANVLKLEEITTGVFVLAYKKIHEFLAGQVVAITTDLNDKPRLYSIASGIREEEVRILFNVVPEGKLTTQMSQLIEGDKIFISKPFGKFTGTKEPAYWIAAGTGIAPFTSMFYSGLASNKIIIHGGRTLSAFYFRNVFEAYFKDNYIPCCSQQTGQGVFKGRLTEYLKSLNELPPKHKYYLCGSAEMVVETRDILIQKGIPFKQIIAEIYF
ncbi:MAG: oxidoreductase [Bacteroidetes bacterium]|nr:oxidoreductase [Bacteroidota bacterium]